MECNKTDQILAISGIRSGGKGFLLKQILTHLFRDEVQPGYILFGTRKCLSENRVPERFDSHI